MNNKIKNLNNEISNSIHEIYSRSLFNVKEISEYDINEINLNAYLLFRNYKDLVDEYEKIFTNMKNEMSKLNSELLLTEIALDKLSGGNSKKIIDSITEKDIIKAVMKNIK